MVCNASTAMYAICYFFRRALCCAALLLPTMSVHATPPAQWDSRGIGGGGGLFSPSLSPFNQSELYIACDMGELFHSTDLGASWNTVDFRQLQAFHETKVQFTSDPAVLYTIDYSANTARPAKSVDGGATWSLTPGTASGWPGSRPAFNLFADPGSTTRLIVTSSSGLYFSNDGGTTFALKYADASGRGLSIGGTFFDGQNIYAGINAGLLVSTDGGNTFSLSNVAGIPSTEAIFSFAGARQGSTTRFYAVTASVGKVSVLGLVDPLTAEDVYGSYRSVYVLDWGQSSWVAAVNGIVAGSQPVMVATANNDISTAYLAGRSAPAGAATTGSAPMIYKTSSGGAVWQSVFLAANNQNIYTGWTGQGGDMGGGNWWWGNTLLGFAVAPNDSSRLLTTDKGGVPHLSTDGGTSWRQVYTDTTVVHAPGIATPSKQYYRGSGMEPTANLSLAWADASHLIAGYADIAAIRSNDGGNTWAFDWNGLNFNVNGNNNYSTEVYQIVVDPQTRNLYAAQSNGMGAIYQSVGLTDSGIDHIGGAIRSSADGGQTWITLHDFGHPVLGLALDPNRPNRLYASVVNSSAGGIYMTNDLQDGAASVWLKLTNPPRTDGHPFNIQVLNDGALLATFSGHIGSSGSFNQSSGVFISNDGGISWLDRSDPGMLYFTKNLTVDNGDSTQSTWYVGTFTNWGGNNQSGALYKTVNRGMTWTRIFTSADVESASMNPLDPNELYVATRDKGLWYSSNAQQPTPGFTQLASYPFLHPIRVYFNPYKSNELWVSSNGNGLRVGLTGQNTQVVGQLFNVPSPGNADAGFLRFYNLGATTIPVTGTLYDQNGAQLGAADLALTPGLPGKGILVLSSADIATLFGVASWSGRAWMEIKSSVSSSTLAMQNLVRSSTLTNMSCVSDRFALNIPMIGSSDQAFVRLYNIGSMIGAVRGTLYDQGGNILGNPNSVLVASMGAKSVSVLTADQIQSATGATGWSGRAWLDIAADFGSDLKIMNLIRDSSNTLNDMSCVFN